MSLRRPLARGTFGNFQLDHAPDIEEIGQQVVDQARIGADLEQIGIDLAPARALQHDATQAVPHLDQPDTGQASQRLAHHCAADLEALAKDLLGRQHTASGEAAGNDLAGDVSNDRIGAATGLHVYGVPRRTLISS